MSKPMITAIGLRVNRDRSLILDVPQITLGQGEVLAVVGANGSGKSTLLQSLALLIPADMNYQFAGEPVDLARQSLAIRRQMAVVFQRPLLVAGSVYDNVALGLRLRHVPRDHIQPRVMQALEMFKVTELANRAAHRLSGGEAQRVSLARALALQPQVLFLDEPFSALDVLTRSAIVQDLRQVLRAGGISTLFVTHDFTEILPLADRLAVLQEGRVIQTDQPSAVFRHPANGHVQDLVRAAADLVGTLDIRA